MLRSLHDRPGRGGLLGSLILFAVVVGPAASATQRDRSSALRGRWTNPVGACVTHIDKVDPATGDVLRCTGTSTWTGTWRGSTTWVLTGDVSLTAGGTGRIDEVFRGRARDGRTGRLTFVEHFTLDASGKIDIAGRIVKSSGRLAGSGGHARWIGSSRPDGSGEGTYSGRWREGRRPSTKHRRHGARAPSRSSASVDGPT